MHLTSNEIVLLWGGPRSAKQEFDGSVRLDLTAEDARGRGSGEWVVYAKHEGREVTASMEEAEALARRVLCRKANDGLLASDSLILDRRAEVLLEASERFTC